MIHESTDETRCDKCNKIAGDTAIECETCSYWFHLKCVDLDFSDLNTIIKRQIHSSTVINVTTLLASVMP